MFSFTKSARPVRRSRRQTHQLREAARAGEVELLEARALLTVPELSSLPGAPATLFLDFDGQTEPASSGWSQQFNSGNPLVTPPFDRDGDPATVNAAEQQIIRQTWARIAEDFAPFTVNVTTIDPGSYNNFETINVVIGGDGAWVNSPGVRGIAFLNSFTNSASNTVYTFSEAFGDSRALAANIALTTSHEGGHAFGLRHQSLYDNDGNLISQYHPGTGDWGPIMGNPFGGVTRDVWHNGPSTNGDDDLQSDMERLARTSNRTFQFREDDHGDSISTATEPTLNDDGSILAEGNVIGHHTDRDFFEFQTDAGPISLSATGLDVRDIDPTSPNAGNNLDIVMRLYDQSGLEIAESDPTGSFNAQIDADVASGTYYVEVTSIDEYGSAGGYTLEGDIIPLPVQPRMTSPSGITSDATPTFTWTAAANTQYYELSVIDTETGIEVIRETDILSESYTHDTALAEGNYSARVRQINRQDKVGPFSDDLDFEVDLNRPGTPVVTAPRGPINNQTPLFTWDPATDASSYELTVTNVETNRVVIFRTSITATQYQHFAPLPDGEYETVVVALNEAGEKGAPSQPRGFTIDSADAEVPQILTPSDDATLRNRRPRITWSGALNSTDYQLQVKSLSSNEIVLDLLDYDGTSYRFGKKAKLPQGTYEARVRGFNILGDATAWSERVIFTIDIPEPRDLEITDPTEVVGTQKPEIEWTKSRYAKKYRIVVTDKNQDDAEVFRATVNGANTLSYIPNRKLPESSLTILIAGINSVGEVGEYATRDVRVDIKAPARPKVTAPFRNTNGTIGIPRPKFEWTPVAYAVRYDLKVQNLTTGETVIREKNLREPSFKAEKNLKDGNNYRVTVRARNTAGEYSKFSRSYDFETRFEVPSTPVMYGPIGDLQTRTPVFEWQNVGAATKIQLFIKDLDTNSTERFTVRASDWEESDDGFRVTYQLGQKLRRSTYQAWVRAIGASSSAKSGYSNSVAFTIVSSESVESLGLPGSDEQLADQPVTEATPAEVEQAASTITVEVVPETVEVVADRVVPPVPETHEVASEKAMTEFATAEWSMSDSVEPVESDATNDENDSEISSLVEASAGLMALPVIAGRLLKRVRNRRDKKRS